MEPRKVTDEDVSNFFHGKKVIYRGNAAADVADAEVVQTPTQIWVPFKISEDELIMLAGESTIWIGMLGHSMPPISAHVALDNIPKDDHA